MEHVASDPAHRLRLSSDGLEVRRKTERDTAQLDQMVEQLRRPDTPLNTTVVLIPVAAAQDHRLIYPALEQYAHAETPHPFTIALNLNQPASLDQDWTSVAQAEVDRARQDFPGLDVRTMQRYYDAPTIGAIRKDLWDAAVELAKQEEPFNDPSDYIGYNHDIDLIRLPPSYLQRTQTTAFMNGAPLISTPVRHYRSGQFPEADRITALFDFINSGVGEAYYEAGLIIPFGTYEMAGGFQPESNLRETHAISHSAYIRRFKRATTAAKSAPLYTSPRRLIQSIADETDPNDIWTDETFGANDSCRHADNDAARRITPARAQAFGRALIRQTLPLYLDAGTTKLFYDDPATPAYSRAFGLSERDRERRDAYYQTKMALAERGLRTILALSPAEASALVADAKQQSRLE